MATRDVGEFTAPAPIAFGANLGVRWVADPSINLGFVAVPQAVSVIHQRNLLVEDEPELAPEHAPD